MKRIFQALEMKKLVDLFVIFNYKIEKLYKSLTKRKYLGDTSAFLSFLIVDEKMTLV